MKLKWRVLWIPKWKLFPAINCLIPLTYHDSQWAVSLIHVIDDMKRNTIVLLTYLTRMLMTVLMLITYRNWKQLSIWNLTLTFVTFDGLQTIGSTPININVNTYEFNWCISMYFPVHIILGIGVYNVFLISLITMLS